VLSGVWEHDPCSPFFAPHAILTKGAPAALVFPAVHGRRSIFLGATRPFPATPSFFFSLVRLPRRVDVSVVIPYTCRATAQILPFDCFLPDKLSEIPSPCPLHTLFPCYTPPHELKPPLLSPPVFIPSFALENGEVVRALHFQLSLFSSFF